MPSLSRSSLLTHLLHVRISILPPSLHLPRTVPIVTGLVRATAGTSHRVDVAVHYHTTAQWVFPGTPVEAVSKQMMVERDESASRGP